MSGKLNWACKQPEMTNLLAHPFPLYPFTQPLPPHHITASLWRERMCVFRANGFLSEHLLILFSLIAYSDECNSTNRMTSRAVYTSWVLGFRALIMNRERVCVRKSPLAWSKIPGRGWGATWINFCGVLRTPTPLLSILWQIIRLASHAGVFREGTKYEVT